MCAKSGQSLFRNAKSGPQLFRERKISAVKTGVSRVKIFMRNLNEKWEKYVCETPVFVGETKIFEMRQIPDSHFRQF